MMLNIALSYSLLLGKSFKTVSFFMSTAYLFRVVQKYLFTIMSRHAYKLVLVTPILRYLSAFFVINITNWHKVILS